MIGYGMMSWLQVECIEGTSQRIRQMSSHKRKTLVDVIFETLCERLEPQAACPLSWWRSPWRIRFSTRVEYCSPQDRELLSEPSHIANRLIEKKFEFGVSAFSCPLRSLGRGPLSKSQHTGTILILRGNWDNPPFSYCALVVNSQYKKRLPPEPTLLYEKN